MSNTPQFQPAPLTPPLRPAPAPAIPLSPEQSRNKLNRQRGMVKHAPVEDLEPARSAMKPARSASKSPGPESRRTSISSLPAPRPSLDVPGSGRSSVSPLSSPQVFGGSTSAVAPPGSPKPRGRTVTPRGSVESLDLAGLAGVLPSFDPNQPRSRPNSPRPGRSTSPSTRRPSAMLASSSNVRASSPLRPQKPFEAPNGTYWFQGKQGWELRCDFSNPPGSPTVPWVKVKEGAGGLAWHWLYQGSITRFGRK